MIAYFHCKLSVCIQVYNFQIIDWCSEPTIPGVTASHPEEAFDLCWMEMGGNHLPNSPAGDNLCLYTDIQTLNTFCSFLCSWFSAGDFESAGRVSVSKIAQAFQSDSKSFQPVGKSDKTATKRVDTVNIKSLVGDWLTVMEKFCDTFGTKAAPLNLRPST